MDGLLGLIIALLVFATVIFFTSRTALSVMVAGACLVLLAALVYIGVL